MTLLQRDPPKVETEDFLRSMVECVDERNKTNIFLKWHFWDTYDAWPTFKEEQLEWAMGYCDMMKVPLAQETGFLFRNLNRVPTIQKPIHLRYAHIMVL